MGLADACAICKSCEVVSTKHPERFLRYALCLIPVNRASNDPFGHVWTEVLRYFVVLQRQFGIVAINSAIESCRLPKA